jgi:hypothetical protein
MFTNFLTRIQEKSGKMVGNNYTETYIDNGMYTVRYNIKFNERNEKERR